MPVPGVASGAVSHRDGGAVRGCNSSSSNSGGLVLSSSCRIVSRIINGLGDALNLSAQRAGADLLDRSNVVVVEDRRARVYLCCKLG